MRQRRNTVTANEELLPKVVYVNNQGKSAPLGRGKSIVRKARKVEDEGGDERIEEREKESANESDENKIRSVVEQTGGGDPLPSHVESGLDFELDDEEDEWRVSKELRLKARNPGVGWATRRFSLAKSGEEADSTVTLSSIDSSAEEEIEDGDKDKDVVYVQLRRVKSEPFMNSWDYSVDQVYESEDYTYTLVSYMSVVPQQSDQSGKELGSPTEGEIEPLSPSSSTDGTPTKRRKKKKGKKDKDKDKDVRERKNTKKKKKRKGSTTEEEALSSSPSASDLKRAAKAESLQKKRKKDRAKLAHYSASTSCLPKYEEGGKAKRESEDESDGSEAEGRKGSNGERKKKKEKKKKSKGGGKKTRSRENTGPLFFGDSDSNVPTKHPRRQFASMMLTSAPAGGLTLGAALTDGGVDVSVARTQNPETKTADSSTDGLTMSISPRDADSPRKSKIATIEVEGLKRLQVSHSALDPMGSLVFFPSGLKSARGPRPRAELGGSDGSGVVSPREGEKAEKRQKEKEKLEKEKLEKETDSDDKPLDGEALEAQVKYEADEFGDSHVSSGTVDGLIYALASEEGACDIAYMHNFLSVYFYFTDAVYLMKQLKKRFFATTTGPEVRLRILNAFTKWVNTYWQDFGSNAALAKELEDFEKRMEAMSEDARRQVALLKITRARAKNRLDRMVNSLHNVQGAPKSYFPFEGQEMTFLNLHPLEVARQMTLIEDSLFRAIQRNEYFHKAWDKPELGRAPNVIRWIKRFNQASYWVATEIILTPNPKQRTTVIQRFIEVAEHCLALGNFNSVMEIYTALNLASITRLKNAWKAVPQRLISKLEEMGKLLAPALNFKNYRQAIEHHPPPLVPIQGIYLQDLTFIEENPDTIPAPGIEGEEWINYSKMSLLGKLIWMLYGWQSKPYLFNEVPSIKEYLLHPTILLDEKELYLGSKNCEPLSRNN